MEGQIHIHNILGRAASPHFELVALKMCLDRTLPVSLFEKDKSQRSAVTINITGLGQEPIVVDSAEQPEDVEAKYG